MLKKSEERLSTGTGEAGLILSQILFQCPVKAFTRFHVSGFPYPSQKTAFKFLRVEPKFKTGSDFIINALP
jgi:hypothetical protein